MRNEKKNVEKKNFYMTPHIMLMKLIHESQLSVFGHSLIENENLRFSLTPGTSHGEEIVKKNFEKSFLTDKRCQLQHPICAR